MTFAYQLAISLPSAQGSIQDALTKDPSIIHQHFEDQFKKLIVDPVLLINEPFTRVVVIDGLDECNNKIHVEDIIRLLISALHELPLKIFVTSRTEAHIESIFTSPSMDKIVKRIALRDFDALTDIHKYLQSSLSKVQVDRNLSPSWPTESDLSQLAQSENNFTYASAVVEIIGDEYSSPQRRLATALEADNGLDSVFEQVLTGATKYPYFDLVVGAITLLRGKAYINILPQLLQLDSVYDVRLALRECSSILLVPDSNDDYIRPRHHSLFGFLTNSRNPAFFDTVKCHRVIVDGCIQLIANDSGKSSSSLRYACQNAPHHVHLILFYANSSNDVESQLGSTVQDFLMDVPRRLPTWMRGLEDTEAVERLREDLHSAITCATVGQTSSTLLPLLT